MSTTSSISIMMGQSRWVLTKPSVATFERFEKQGTLNQAILYVGLAAAITGVFGLVDGIGGFLANIVVTLVGFLVFTYLVHWIGKQRGGTGSLDEVAYSFALFWAPLSVLFGIASFILVITIVGIVLLPLLALAALALNVYFAYLAVQSSMNISGGGATWTVLLLAALGSFLVNLLAAAILGGS
jgi:hypothetical protein